MEWWGWVTWAVALGGGLYGAWRSWRTDRSLKLLGKKWELVPQANDQSMYLLANRMPRRAYDVKVSGPAGRIIMWHPDGTVNLEPNGEHLYTIITTYNHDLGPMTVTWNRRASLRGTPCVWSGHLPAPVAPDPFS